MPVPLSPMLLAIIYHRFWHRHQPSNHRPSFGIMTTSTYLAIFPLFPSYLFSQAVNISVGEYYKWYNAYNSYTSKIWVLGYKPTHFWIVLGPLRVAVSPSLGRLMWMWMSPLLEDGGRTQCEDKYCCFHETYTNTRAHHIYWCLSRGEYHTVGCSNPRWGTCEYQREKETLNILWVPRWGTCDSRDDT